MENSCKPLTLFLALFFLISYSTLALANTGLGDLDGDNDIDMADYLIFRSSLGSNAPAADYDGDGEITYADLSFSTSTTPVASAVLVGPTSNIFVGDTFDVDVFANDVGDEDKLLAFGFDLDYGSTAFAFNGATMGSLLFFDDSLLFSDTDVAGSNFPGLSGDDILLASLSFTSLTAGTFSLGITSSSLDLNEGLTTLLGPKIDMTQSLFIEASDAPIPEPSTILLLGSGLVGLAFYRRRLKAS